MSIAVLTSQPNKGGNAFVQQRLHKLWLHIDSGGSLQYAPVHRLLLLQQ